MSLLSSMVSVWRLQVYAAGRGKAPLRVYNLRYKDSFEQDRYMAALQREQRVFEDLIRSKGHMVLPELGQVRTCACSRSVSGVCITNLEFCFA